MLQFHSIVNRFIFCIFILLFSSNQILAQKTEQPNILFIAIDDLKPILGCYGDSLVKTPNIDRLASMGTVFLSNYCQQAVCGPTRASLMTGMRPDVTKVWDLKTRMRDMNPDIVTLPQYLITKGYQTSGIGKIYHPSCVDKKTFDGPSWSIPFLKATPEDYANGLGAPALGHYQSPETKALINKNSPTDNEKVKKEDENSENLTGNVKPSSECLNLPDNAYEDGVNALLAKNQIIALSKSGKPYFMAVGFHKPHMPFVSPKKYWDLYRKEDMPLAEFQQHSKNGPKIAYTRSGELRNYTDIPPFVTIPEDSLGIGLKPEKQKELIQAYYAAVSYTDAQVGILLKTLDSLGTLNNTIIVLWGDHGWHLGDHDLWNKHTNFEQATRSPLIIAAPGLKPGKTKSITEHLDIFPTVCSLAGLPIPAQLEGKSLVPVMKNKNAKVKDFAVSQYPRKLKKEEFSNLGLKDGKLMGYAIRTEQFRMVLWLNNNFTSKEAFTEDRVYARELYDYKKDPLEKVNVVNEKKYAIISKDLYTKMIEFFKSQLK